VKKLICLAGLLVGLAFAMAWLRAQTPTAETPDNATVVPPDATNKDELMRQVLREAISNAVAKAAAPGATNTTPPTNLPPALATNIPAQTSEAPVAPTPEPLRTAVPSGPVPGSTNAAGAGLAGRTNLQTLPVRGRTAAPAPAFPAFPALPAPASRTAQATSGLPAQVVTGLAATNAPGAQVQAGLTGTNAPAKGSPEDLIEALNFPQMPFDQALDFYSNLTEKNVLRQTVIVGAPPTISIKTRTPLTRKEAIDAFNAVFALNGVSVLPVGEKFLKIVPTLQAGQEATPFSKTAESDLSEMGQYITKVIQLQYAKPADIAQLLMQFASGKAGQNVIALDANQLVVMRDYAPNIKRMMEMIAKIDVNVPSEVQLEVIQIKYALASDIASVLGSLTSGGGGAPAGTATGAARRTTGRTSRTGTMGTVGTYGQPGTTPGTLGQPGQPGAAAARTSFQSRLDAITRRALGGEIQVLSEAKIIPDERTNSILIFANKEDLAMIKRIVSLLDVVQQQVLIEVVIMEVNLDDQRTVGVSVSQSPKSLGGNAIGGGGWNSGTGFLSSTNVQNFPASLGSGFSYFGKIAPTWDATLTAIATDGSIKVLQRPRIQTSHAEEATLFIGETRPYVMGTYYGGYSGSGMSSSQYQQKQIGITLNVLPLINQDGLVVLQIDQQIQSLGNDVMIDGNPVPTTTDRNASAKVAVRDGDTIILGGFIGTTTNRSKSGVPFLKDIPIIGYLFRSTNDQAKRVELVVLIHPTVLPTPEIASITATREKAKLSGIRAAEQDEQQLERAQQRRLGVQPAHGSKASAQESEATRK